MNISLTLTTDFPILGSFLSGTAPEGVSVEFSPPVERRAIDVNVTVNLDVNLIIDISKIAGIIFATWLVRSIRDRKREIEVRINGKQLPKNEAEAIEFVTREISSQENDGKSNQ
jgi:hypothetical protein